MPIENECDGAGPHAGTQTRVYPLGGGGNLILCWRCWFAENRYRRDRINQLGANPQAWPRHDWNSAEIYWRE